MASGGGKGGKGGKGSSSGQVKWLARDCRQEFGGSGARPGAQVQQRPRGRNVTSAMTSVVVSLAL